MLAKFMLMQAVTMMWGCHLRNSDHKMLLIVSTAPTQRCEDVGGKMYIFQSLEEGEMRNDAYSVWGFLSG